MVSMNFRYLGSLPGLLKLGTSLLLLISISLGGHAYEKSLYNLLYKMSKQLSSSAAFEIEFDMSDGIGLSREQAFLGFTILIFMIAIILLFCHISNVDVPFDVRFKFIDIVFHGIGTIFLLIAGSLIIDSSRRINSNVCSDWKEINSTELMSSFKCQYRGEKDFAGIFALLTSALYGLITVMQILRFSIPNPTG